jgi:hypothetical protein
VAEPEAMWVSVAVVSSGELAPVMMTMPMLGLKI